MIKKAYFQLHLAVLLYGFTAILGKLISLNAVVLVWWRVLLTSLSLLLLVNVIQLFRTMPRHLVLKLMGVGVLVGLHWITFYGSIKLANASIALVCFATASFFTALLEPLVLKQKVDWFEITIGIAIIPGMILIVNGVDFSMIEGFLTGLISAFLASLFTVLNKKYVDTVSAIRITFLEMSAAWLFLCLIVPFYLAFSDESVFWPSWKDLGYLLFLSLVCTTFAYVISLRALKHLTAFAANLAYNLEPVYGIVLAWLILQENQELSASFYWGVVLILATIIGYPFLKMKFKLKN